MTQTLRRELKLKITEVLHGHVFFHEIPLQESEKLVEELADAVLQLRGFSKPKIDLKNSDPAWAILAGESVKAEQIEEVALGFKAKETFERDMRFNPLPWGANKQWEKLEKFILQEYRKDELIFSKYKTWQEGDGKYVALSNRKIKDKPEDFIACFPDFLAHVEMYSKPKQEGSSGHYA